MTDRPVLLSGFVCELCRTLRSDESCDADVFHAVDPLVVLDGLRRRLDQGLEDPQFKAFRQSLPPTS